MSKWPNPDLSFHALTIRDLAQRSDGRLKPRITRSDLTDALLEIADQLDALERPIVVDGWQSIDTAPKTHDGMLLTDGRQVSQGGWLSQLDQGADYEGQAGCPSAGWWSVDNIEHPTHWQPLPAAPIVVTRTER